MHTARPPRPLPPLGKARRRMMANGAFAAAPAGLAMTRFVAGARRGAPAARHARAPHVSARPVTSFGGRRARGVARGRSPASRLAAVREPAGDARRADVASTSFGVGRAPPRRAGQRLGGRRATRPRGEIRGVELRRRRRHRRRRDACRFRRVRVGRAPTRVLTPRRARAERRRGARGRRDGTRAGGGTPRMLLLRLPKRSLRKRESPKRSITAYERARGPSITARAAKRRTRRWTWTTC